MSRATSSRKAPGLTKLLFQPNVDHLYHQWTQSETVVSWRPLMTRTFSCILQVSSLSAESVLTLLFNSWVDKTLTTCICRWFSHKKAAFPIMGSWFVQTLCTLTQVPSDLQPKCNHMESGYCGGSTGKTGLVERSPVLWSRINHLNAAWFWVYDLGMPPYKSTPKYCCESHRGSILRTDCSIAKVLCTYKWGLSLLSTQTLEEK